MIVRRSLALVSLVAALHGLFFIWYQRPDWTTQWSDQGGYRRLGQVIAETGRLTRYPDEPRFVPEVIRTPMYPAFVALIYRVFGVHQTPVALAQTGLFVLICLVVFRIARRVSGDQLAILAASLTALYPPIPYFAALVMTEVWTTFLFTVSMWMAVRAVQDGAPRAFAWLGLVLALTALSRPVFVLFPIALAATGVVIFPLLGVRRRPKAGRWAVLLVVFAVAMLPWFLYNYATIGRVTISPAGGFGRALWEGSWQAVWSGRLQNELTLLADDIDDRAELDRRVEAIAAREHLPAGPMLEYVHQWEDIRRIWTEPVDPHERVLARVRADDEYLRVAIQNVRRDSLPHLLKRLARGVFVLWAGEIPFRYSDINQLSPIVIYACWALQAVLFALAMYGVYALARRGRPGEACLLAAPIVYITAVHLLLLTEARQSLPAQPVLLLLATIGVTSLLALEPQVHEREHL